MPKKTLFALILMGFTSLVVQTLLIREFLISFYGNELTIGIILANWIILEALGSILCSKLALRSNKPRLVYTLLQTGIALYLPLSIFLIRNIKNILGLALGEGIGILPIFFSSFFILAPLSIFDGAQFPFGCRILSEDNLKPAESAGRVYILEALGFILAGPIFTYILLTRVNSFSIAFCIGALNLLSVIFLLKKKLIPILLFFLVVMANFGPVDIMNKFSLAKQWQDQEVLSYRNSIYGNLAVIKSKEQYTFYNNGLPIITTPFPDVSAIEELVHFTLLSTAHPKKVLLLSGGAGGVIKEILKYPVEKLTYTELDPLLIKLIQDFPTELTKSELSDPRLEIKYMDARRFIRIAKEKYDVIILNLPMPSTLQLNRFYTQECFQSISSVLNKDGVFSLALPGSLSYLSPALVNLNATILNTLESVFHVNIIPGDVNLYLSAKEEFKISPEIFLKRLAQNNIQTQLLNPYFLEYRLHPRWLKWFQDSLSGYSRMRKNLDLLPQATFYSIAYWNDIFSSRLQGLFKALDKLNFKVLGLSLFLLGLILFILNICIPGFKKASIGFAIATTGFVGMSFDLILIYAYQSFYGFVFSHLGLLVTAFMAGIALGGWQMTKNLNKIKNAPLTFSKIELAITSFCILVGLLLITLKGFLSLGLSPLFFLLSGICGYLVGLEFPLANKIYKSNTKTAGLLYALDLFGAWLAALIVSVALVPVIGIIPTCFLLAGLKIISLAWVAAS